MPNSSIADSAITIGNRIGRYFSLVSMLPALLLVLWSYMLLASGAWSGVPRVDAVLQKLSHWTLGGAAWALVATLVVALFLHPLQFATTQLLEGYWGTSRLARLAMATRIVHHRRRRSRLDQLEQRHQRSWHREADTLLHQQHAESLAHGYMTTDTEDPDNWGEEYRAGRRASLLDSDAGEQLVVDVVTEDAARRSWSRYPDGGRVMPTRLGNVLRRFEDAAGSQYGLEAISIAPHLALVAPERHLSYLQDSRQQLDTTIRLCMVSLIATTASIVVLFRDGVWLLVALLPYTLAYIAYRGALSSAEEYGTAVSTVIDLDRFLLYEQLHIEKPRSTRDEQTKNQDLLRLLEGDAEADIRYRRDETIRHRRDIKS